MKSADATAFGIEPLGDTALLLRFGERVDAAINARVHAVAQTLRDAKLPGVTNVTPAFATLALHYDPAAWVEGADPAQPWERLCEAVQNALRHIHGQSDLPARMVEIPVRYGGEDGADLPALAAELGLTPTEIVARHVAVEYTVAMLGFAPGFPYLLGLDPALNAPRLARPRTRVPAGSVAIGGAQTGIYPRELPGGWRLIGRTPLVLFDVRRDSPSLLLPGDRVRFRAIETVPSA